LRLVIVRAMKVRGDSSRALARTLWRTPTALVLSRRGGHGW